MAYPPAFLDALRSRLSLAQIVGRKVKLIRKGREHQGLCPFHTEKTPSFTVNEDKGFFHCFGCGAHGDAIGFEMRIHGLSFTEAVERLAAECGIEVPRASPEERQREQRRASLHEALEAACTVFESELRAPAGRAGFAYLKSRGLADETIGRFRLGWAPDSRDTLKRALMSGRLPESLLIEAGLLKKPEGGGASFDYFRGRVTFPITDRRGRIVGFGARTLGDAQPKYLNSPETPLFHKGSMLYGLAQAREPARAAGTLVVVEGYMDVIALSQAGIEAAVAPLGTALTETQIEEAWRLAPEPVLCLDGDSAGQRAMGRALERAVPLLKPGHSLRFATLPSGEDPDSLVRRRGPAAITQVLAEAEPLVEAAWRHLREGQPLDTPERRAALDQALSELAGRIADPTVRWHYISAFRQKMRDAARPPRAPWVPRAGGRQGGRGPGAPSRPLADRDGRLPGIGHPAPPLQAGQERERQLLTLLLDHPALLDHVAERLGEAAFGDNTLDKLRRAILKHAGAARALDADALVAHLRSDGFSPLLDSLLDASSRQARSVSGSSGIAQVRAQWEDVFRHHTRKDLLADVNEASARLAQETTLASWRRFEAMKRQDRVVMGGDDAAEDGIPPPPAED